MPWAACGSFVCSTVPPSSSIRRKRLLEDLRHAGLDALGLGGELGRAPRSAGRAGLAAGKLAPRLGDSSEVESQGSLPTRWRKQQRRVGDVAGQRPALVERRGEGDHAVARHRAVGRLQPDDSAQRRRLADRAAGVGADRPGREPGGDRRCRAAARATGHAVEVPRVVAPARRPSSRSRSPSRTRPCWSCRASATPARGEPADGGRGVGRPVAFEDARARGRRHAFGAEDVLDRERQTRPAADRRPAAPAARRRDPQIGAELARRCARSAPR